MERSLVSNHGYLGTSNIFFVIDDELVTPSLGGTILSGVTRDSVLQLARQWGLKVAERPISIDEVIEGCQSGAITEIFATGTAAAISPIGEIGYLGQDFRVADGQVGELSQKLYGVLTGIQYGQLEYPFGWRVRLV